MDDTDRIADNLEEIIARTIDDICARDARIAKLEAALKSIADNTCCDSCREAALVARKALEE